MKHLKWIEGVNDDEILSAAEALDRCYASQPEPERIPDEEFYDEMEELRKAGLNRGRP